MQDLKPTPKRRNVLEEFKNRLSQSTESWKSRVQVDPELKKLGAASRARRKLFQEKLKSTSDANLIASKSIGGSSSKAISRAYTDSSSVSPPSKIVHLASDQTPDADSFPKFTKSGVESRSVDVFEPSSSILPPLVVASALSSDKENESFYDATTKPTTTVQVTVGDAVSSFLQANEVEEASTSEEGILDSTVHKKTLSSSSDAPGILVSFFEKKCKEATPSSALLEKEGRVKAKIDEFVEVPVKKIGFSATTDLSDLDAIKTTGPKLVGPFKAVARGRTRSEAAKRLQFSTSTEAAAVETPKDYRVKQSEDDGSGIAASAKRGLQAKIDFLSAVQLKKRDVSTGYPDLMLIRIKGTKRPDVRLVAPKYSSLCNYGVYVLVTPKKLFFYHGKFANLRERTKATVIAKSVTTKKGELGCHAKVAENVNETKKSEFWKLLGCSGPQDIIEDEARNMIFEGEEAFESFIAKTNLVFQVCEDQSIERILTGVAPKCSIMDPKANLIFDFGSEIYVWSGRSANKGGFQQAVAYAKQLQQQSAPHIPDSKILFGDDFSERRPDWCIFFKISQGLADCLFRDKFADWKHTDEEAAFQIRKPKPGKKTEIVTESYEEALASKLAKSLLAYTPSETKLILEDTEIGRDAENIFTDDLHYYLVEGENKLTELKQLNLLFKNACYIIRWDYRVEREGIHKLTGEKDENDRDTGRQRVCFFFWLGSDTSNKEQGVCALALRNFDRERHPHERVVQGQEPFVFLALFKGSLATVGHETRVFLVHSSFLMKECYLEELPAPITLRSHGCYIVVTKEITVWYGKEASQKERKCAKYLAESLAKIEDPYLDCLDKSSNIVELEEVADSCNMPVISAKNWQKAPRLIRLVENEGGDLNYVQWDATAPFSFRQHELRDTMIIDQGSGIWLWTDDIPTNQHLRVAAEYSKGRSGFAVVICKTKEPDEFKALFPTWKDFVDPEFVEEDPEKKPPTRNDPIDVEELLKQRNQKYPLEKVRARDLPEGSDLKRLEQYLNDDDFEKVFKMGRNSFYALPPWKQINLRKSNDLF